VDEHSERVDKRSEDEHSERVDKHSEDEHTEDEWSEKVSEVAR